MQIATNEKRHTFHERLAIHIAKRDCDLGNFRMLIHKMANKTTSQIRLLQTVKYSLFTFNECVGAQRC